MSRGKATSGQVEARSDQEISKNTRFTVGSNCQKFLRVIEKKSVTTVQRSAAFQLSPVPIPNTPSTIENSVIFKNKPVGLTGT